MLEWFSRFNRFGIYIIAHVLAFVAENRTGVGNVRSREFIAEPKIVSLSGAIHRMIIYLFSEATVMPLSPKQMDSLTKTNDETNRFITHLKQ